MDQTLDKSSELELSVTALVFITATRLSNMRWRKPPHHLVGNGPRLVGDGMFVKSRNGPARDLESHVVHFLVVEGSGENPSMAPCSDGSVLECLPFISLYPIPLYQDFFVA